MIKGFKMRRGEIPTDTEVLTGLKFFRFWAEKGDHQFGKALPATPGSFKKAEPAIH